MSQDVALAANSTPLWRNVSFHLLWSSTFASGVGDRLIMNAALVMLGYAGRIEESPQGRLAFIFQPAGFCDITRSDSRLPDVFR